jgi:hypothetical protein
MTAEMVQDRGQFTFFLSSWMAIASERDWKKVNCPRVSGGSTAQ